MRDFFSLLAALIILPSIEAMGQTYNLFPASDIDSDGWLWFDTQEKIDKYIGNIDETNYRIEKDGKIIQTVYADQMPDYPASEVSPDFIGAGTDGETGSEGYRKGGIMLQPASQSMTVNGGGFLVCLPSCATYSICYSSNSKVMARIVATKNVNTDMSNASNSKTDINSADGWHVISASHVTVFGRLPMGIYKWEGIEKLNNNDNVTIQSNDPIYVWFQSATKDTVYIHGIKVTTPKQETTGVKMFTTSAKPITSQIYTIDGKQINNAPKALREGFYIVRDEKGTRKISVK